MHITHPIPSQTTAARQVCVVVCRPRLTLCSCKVVSRNVPRSSLLSWSTRPVQLQQQPSTVLQQRTVHPVEAERATSSRDVSTSASAGQQDANSEIPKEGLVSRLLRPLKDFGFGKKSFWEGGVGMFIFVGVGACTGTVVGLPEPPIFFTASCSSSLLYPATVMLYSSMRTTLSVRLYNEAV